MSKFQDISNMCLYLCHMKAHQRKTVNLRITEHLVLPECIIQNKKGGGGRESALKEQRWQKKTIPSDTSTRDRNG